ncbi:MAG: FAD-dependent oxidoreductase [Chloroflexi bacterium]|nr:FAD-dependent oxidoreductase [Chloroflexota bacterium]
MPPEAEANPGAGGERVGVYVCHCGTNIAGTVDVAAVRDWAAGRLKDRGVVIARDYRFMCSSLGQELIEKDIQELGLTRVVVAACSPHLHENTFRTACARAGLNPYLCELASIREQVSWVHTDKEAATAKAKAVLSGAVERVIQNEPLEPLHVPINEATLVVGGGIAGIQAALEIADAGFPVYLVEREPSVGGHMAQFDKTFPTLDCAACILTPKMTTVGQHPHIKLMSYSQVEEVSGYVGNFRAKIRRNARYVDETKCTGCRECAKVCPIELDSEFEEGLAGRKAIYIPFPQAVPNKATVDKKGYPPCRVACPAGVNAQGYVALISQGKFKEALEVVRRTMPFAGAVGRVCNHPCEVDCERATVDESMSIRSLKRFVADYELKIGREKVKPVELTKTDRVAVVGSGPAGLACAYDLVRKGYPVTVFEAAPMAGGLLRYGIPEYRLPKKVLDSEISYIKELGVDIKTSTPAKDIGQLFDKGYRAIFLGTGAGLSQKMGIPGEEIPGVIYALDFLKYANSGVKVNLGSRVAVVGGGNAAIDAARVAWRLGAKEVTIIYRRSRAEMPAVAEEVEEAEHEGVKMHFLAAPVRVIARDGRLIGVECIRMELGEPDASGRRRPTPVKGSEFVVDVDSLVIAVGQSVDKAGLAKELTYTGWGTLAVDPVTLETNISGVFAGGDAVAGPADVIAAIAAGKEAAESIDRYLSGTDLRQGRPEQVTRVKEVSKAGVKSKARATMPVMDLSRRTAFFAEVELGYDEKTAIEEAKRCLSCAVCSECLECVKVCEAGAIDHDMKDEVVEVDVGSIIVATGFQQFDPSAIYQYGYGRYPNVMTGLQFERASNASGPTGGELLLADGRKPEGVAIFHCVGSRDENYHKYCSRVCCMYSLKYSHLLREKLPDAQVYQLYIDMRCAGSGYEEFYERLQEEGVNFVRGRAGEITDIAESPDEEGKLIVLVEDTLIRRKRRLPVDMVILSCALEPAADAGQVARTFSISRKADGFFLEKHPKLDPVATMTDGVFVVGCCQSPKDIPDTVAQASAAAARALAMISKGKVEIEAATSLINEELCSGCRVCNALCPFSAIIFDEEKKVSRVNEAVCKGCGVCVAACPSGAITGRHFTAEQIMAEIEGVLA